MKEIPLSKNGKNKGKYFVKVDDDDYDFLMQLNWCVAEDRSNYYAARNEDRKQIKMHRVLMECSYGDGKIVDHKDRDGLNCQKYNLRFATQSENLKNRTPHGSSKFLGVYISKNIFAKKKFIANICYNYSHIYIGSYLTEIEAAKAYNIKAIELHGEFANLNKI